MTNRDVERRNGRGGIETPSDRQCTATARRTGERCARWAIAGGTVCPTHGGSTGHVKGAAARRVAEAGALAAFERYGGPADDRGSVNVVRDLGRLVAAVTAFRDFADARLQALTGEQWAEHGPRVAAEVRMFETACDQARRLLRDVARLGLDQIELEQRVRTAEEEAWREVNAVAGAMMGRAVERILTELDVHDERVSEVVPRVFRGLAAELAGHTPDG